MALENVILNQFNPDLSLLAYTGPGRYVRKYTVKLADIVALGAFTSGDVTLTNLPANSVVLFSLVKHSTAVAGPSISAATAQLITGNNSFGTAFNVFQAVSTSARDQFINVTATSKENFAVVTPLMLHLTSTGANLSAVTAGQIDVTVIYEVLP
jgi:hypothetical protein